MDAVVGKIITFYSYKGGVGRSMALANIACLLSKGFESDGQVLMIDWDLEAPGLHHFFHGKFNDKHGESDDKRDLPVEQMGLIDFFYKAKDRLDALNLTGEISDAFFDELDFQKYLVEIKFDIGSVFMLPAGRSDDGQYSSRVNGFDWVAFFDKNPSFFTKFALFLKRRFRYVLIDSRTGYTDISGICTSIMPEKLVVVFTPSRQSLVGVVELIRRATGYRKQSDDLRQLVVFPLASRIENAESDLRRSWRFGDSTDGIIGYQEQLQNVLREVYDLQQCDLTNYFDEIQLQYVPRYSYGEELAVFLERTGDRLSLANSYKNFTQWLVLREHPWGRKLRVFLFHAPSDRPIVRELYQRLLGEGWIDPWLDEENLLPGQESSMERERALESVDMAITCLSKQSLINNGYIQRELKSVVDIAREKPENSMFIVPIRLDDCDVPRSLRPWQYVDFSSVETREQEYGRLVRSLKLKYYLINK